GRVATDMLDPQSFEDLASLLQRRGRLRGIVRAQGWAEAEKAKAQRNPAAMREHEQIFGQAPRGPVGFQELKNTSFFQAFLVTRDYKMGRSRAELDPSILPHPCRGPVPVPLRDAGHPTGRGRTTGGTARFGHDPRRASGTKPAGPQALGH